MPKSMYSIDRDALVPIVGQGVRVLGYSVLPMVLCDCGQLEPLQLVLHVGSGGTGASIATCPRCQITYRLLGLTIDPHGNVSFNLDQQKPQAVA